MQCTNECINGSVVLLCENVCVCKRDSFKHNDLRVSPHIKCLLDISRCYDTHAKLNCPACWFLSFWRFDNPHKPTPKHMKLRERAKFELAWKSQPTCIATVQQSAAGFNESKQQTMMNFQQNEETCVRFWRRNIS